MPLPTALASRLAKRGIINKNSEKITVEKDKKRDYKGVTSCPNKSNPYHDCSHWCEIHWRSIVAPDAKYMRNIGKLLMRYPLPHTWTEVYDKGLGHYYFWDMESDMVSWLPPRHPKSFVTESAARIREKRITGIVEETRQVSKIDEERKIDKKRSSKSSRHDRDRDRDRESESHHRRRRHSDREHSTNSSNKKKKLDEDPMDPSSYSDVPPGTWSDGLETQKSAADSTANGALFQARPYPSPGEILSGNSKAKPKTKKSVNFGGVSYSN